MHSYKISLWFALSSVAFLMASGCTSIQMKPLFQDQRGNLYGDLHSKGTKGVPCKFKVKKGIRLSLIETIVVSNEGKVLPLGHRGNPLLKIQEQDIEEDQFFLVHVPRPLAGTLEIGSADKPGYSFNDKGYLTGIGAMVEDKTIEDVTSVLAGLAPGGETTKSKGMFQLSENDSQTPGDFVVRERLVATRDFYWSDPNWHCAVNDWLQEYECNNLTCESVAAENRPQVASKISPKSMR
jgi:hypothetical protein